MPTSLAVLYPPPMCSPPQLRGFNSALTGVVSEQPCWGGRRAGVFNTLSLVKRECLVSSIKSPSKDTVALPQHASQLPEAPAASRVSSHVTWIHTLHGFLFSFGGLETSATPSGRTTPRFKLILGEEPPPLLCSNPPCKRGIPTPPFPAITGLQMSVVFSLRLSGFAD